MCDNALLRRRVINLGQGSARQRIAHVICELNARQEAAGLAEPSSPDWPLTQEQHGDVVGLTAVHTNRTLRGLAHDGLIAVPTGSMVILDRPALEAEAEFDPSYLCLRKPAEPMRRDLPPASGPPSQRGSW